jgi:catechol 2,3-dioxygenase-like lactoylglutathione lyase family enzyme
MMSLKLNHVALTVSDREVSARFYSRYFGLSERLHDDDHLLILASAEGSLLALSHGEKPAVPPRTTHFGFEAASASDVRTLRAAFRADGVAEAEWQEFGPTRVQVFDPDGYRVEAYAF